MLFRPRNLPVLLALTLVPAAAPGQQFRPDARAYQPPARHSMVAHAVADIDGDGREDLVYLDDDLGYFQAVELVVLRADGRSALEELARYPMSWPQLFPGQLALGDFDGDGDVDALVFPGTLDVFCLLLNDGTGGLQNAGILTVPGGLQYVCSGLLPFDADGDGDVDFLSLGGRRQIGTSPGSYVISPELLFVNLGRGIFAPGGTLPAVGREAGHACACDSDRDGDLDLLLHDETKLLHYRNDGGGNFTDVSAATLPTLLFLDDVTDLVAGDVDGDGDADCVVGRGWEVRSNRILASPDHLLLNDGRGNFRDATGQLPAGSGGTGDFELADLDGDGDLDLLASSLPVAMGAPGLPGQRFLRNNGSGRFADHSAAVLPTWTKGARGIRLLDLDGDGDRDLVLAQAQRITVAFWDGARLLDGSQWRLPGDLPYPQAAALVDVDGDRNLDVVALHDAWDSWPPGELRLAVSINDSRGHFAATVWQSLGASAGSFGRALAAGDIDGDGDADLAIGIDIDRQNRLLRNDGGGAFTDVTATQLPARPNNTQALLFADVDIDGDPDLIVGNADLGGRLGESNELLLNDGAGRFTDAPAGWLPATQDNSFVLAAADVDGDGDLDLAVGNTPLGGRPGANRLLVNQGPAAPGTFVAQPPGSDNESTQALAFGDVDGDGDVDLFVGNGGLYGRAGNFLLVNDGRGAFVEAPSSWLPTSTGHDPTALADCDRDGDLDLLGNGLWINDGTGRFTDASAARWLDVPWWARALVGDVDGDGDADVMSLGYLKEPSLRVNHHRQLGAPRLLRPGDTYELQLSAEPGYGPPGGRPTLLLLGTRRLARPLVIPQLGNYWLDPRATLLGPIVTVAGTRALSIPVPASLPSGLDLHLQAIVLHGGSAADLRFTNALTETVRVF